MNDEYSLDTIGSFNDQREFADERYRTNLVSHSLVTCESDRGGTFGPQAFLARLLDRVVGFVAARFPGFSLNLDTFALRPPALLLAAHFPWPILISFAARPKEAVLPFGSPLLSPFFLLPLLPCFLDPPSFARRFGRPLATASAYDSFSRATMAGVSVFKIASTDST